MKKKDIKEFMVFMTALLESPDVIIKFEKLPDPLHGLLEIYNVDDNEDDVIYRIKLDPGGYLLPALVHEFLHLYYPDAKEEEVEDATVEVFKSLRKEDLLFLLLLLARKAG
ncbi:MAG: hypothetical protein JRJ29_00305 [Deltaproteobacteria bacterium]|nr:hypothetical protein [Deltaproteobacteria bacterium]MBW2081607.1 hypothetical protein [Deltaproteobacteria bacterium]